MPPNAILFIRALILVLQASSEHRSTNLIGHCTHPQKPHVENPGLSCRGLGRSLKGSYSVVTKALEGLLKGFLGFLKGGGLRV